MTRVRTEKIRNKERAYKARVRKAFFKDRRCVDCGTPFDLVALDAEGYTIDSVPGLLARDTVKIQCRRCHRPFVHGTKYAVQVRKCVCPICMEWDQTHRTFMGRAKQSQEKFLERIRNAVQGSE